MENEVKVSIIVPVYNMQKYLSRCIESLLVQTFKELEIILVNDGSKDNSEKICNDYADKYDFIRVIHKVNGGLSDARNVGINISKGKYLIFIDSDDWCEQNMVESLYNTISIDNYDLGICGYYIDYVNREKRVEKNVFNLQEKKTLDIKEIIYELEKSKMFNMVWNKIYKKEIIDENKIRFKKDGVPGEDLLFNCEYFKMISRIKLCEKNLYHYMRQGEETLASTYRKDLLDKVKIFNKAREEIYLHYEMTQYKYEQMYINLYMENIMACVLNIFRKKCLLSEKEKAYVIENIFKDAQNIRYLKRYKPKNVFEKIFKIMFYIKNLKLILSVYKVIFWLRYNFVFLYDKLLVNQIKKEMN